jgi:hypothetical protein
MAEVEQIAKTKDSVWNESHNKIQITPLVSSNSSDYIKSPYQSTLDLLFISVFVWIAQ